MITVTPIKTKTTVNNATSVRDMIRDAPLRQRMRDVKTQTLYQNISKHNNTDEAALATLHQPVHIFKTAMTQVICGRFESTSGVVIESEHGADPIAQCLNISVLLKHDYDTIGDVINNLKLDDADIQRNVPMLLEALDELLVHANTVKYTAGEHITVLYKLLKAQPDIGERVAKRMFTSYEQIKRVMTTNSLAIYKTGDTVTIEDTADGFNIVYMSNVTAYRSNGPCIATKLSGATTVDLIELERCIDVCIAIDTLLTTFDII